MTLRAYLDSDALTAAATVTECARDERGAYLVLDRTIFHPQGGGQRADRGTIEGAPVAFVGNADTQVRHYVESAATFTPGQTVRLAVDGALRGVHARLHSGGHLIAALVEALRPGCRALAGHHWPGEARVEFEALPVADAAALAAEIQAAVEQAVAAALPVRVAQGAQREVAIGPHRAVPCGGTHVRDTAALAGLRITGVKEKKGRTRVSYELAA